MDYDTQLFYLLGTSHFPEDIVERDVPLNIKQIIAAKKAYEEQHNMLDFVRNSSIKELLDFWFDVAKMLPAGTLEQSYRKPRRKAKGKQKSNSSNRKALADFF